MVSTSDKIWKFKHQHVHSVQRILIFYDELDRQGDYIKRSPAHEVSTYLAYMTRRIHALVRLLGSPLNTQICMRTTSYHMGIYLIDWYIIIPQTSFQNSADMNYVQAFE